jgi:dTDP-4-dehydrorhamnose 3,5-epimerase
MDFYKNSEFIKNGIKEVFLQDSHSRSNKGVLRGLHYQTGEKSQAKIIRCIKGEVFDCAVDIRRGSPTFGKWAGAILSEENKNMIYIPKGFSHGFCVLSESAELLYKLSNEYAPEAERGIRWNDPDIGIDWPIASPTILPRDASWPLLKDAVDLF